MAHFEALEICLAIKSSERFTSSRFGQISREKLTLSAVSRVLSRAFVSLAMNYTGCRALSEEEVSRVANSFCGRYAARDRALFLLGIHTGFRVSELLALQVLDVWDGAEIGYNVTVRRAYMKGRRASRSVPIHRRARKALADWMACRWARAELMVGEMPLFPRQRTNRAMTPHQVRAILKEAARRAGIQLARVATHSMRKTFATRMWRSPFIDRDMAKMARLLGHENFSNTLRYIQFLDGTLEQAVLEEVGDSVNI